MKKKQSVIGGAQKRRFRYGSFATIATVLFVVAVILVNLVASALDNAFPLRFDLTSNSFYSLDEKTENMVRELEDDITIYVLGTRENIAQAKYCPGQTLFDLTPTFSYMTQLLETLDTLPKLSDRLTVSYVDLALSPGFASQYPNEELLDGSLIVRSGDKYRVLNYFNLFRSDVTTVTGSYTFYIVSSVVESGICSAIVNVTSDSQQLVTLLTGHNEADSETLVNLLQTNNFRVQEVDITTGAIDSESVFAVLNAPQRDYSDEELQKLTQYLQNGDQFGKNLMLFFDASQPALPNLSEFLQEWGVSVGDQIIYETDASRVYAQGIFFKANYDSSLYASSVMEQGAYVALLGARPIQILWDSKNYVTTTSLLGAASSSVLSPVTADSSWTPSQSDAKGPFSGLVLSEKNPLRDPAKTSRVYTWGTSYAVASNVLNNPAYANSEYVASIFNTVTNNDAVVEIAPKTVAEYRVNLSKSQANGIGLIFFTILVPLATLVTGTVIYLRRRTL